MKVPRLDRTASIAAREYAPYIEATWGLKNHWYPAFFSDEISEPGMKAVTIAGHDIIVRRVHGKLHALRDKCAHRGARFSQEPMCLSDETISCWYHGFTYGLADGVLKTILASPDDPLIGKLRIRTYPIEERGGMIFIFVGDEEYRPLPALESDLPPRMDDNPIFPYLLDEDVFLRGIHRPVNSNWRLGMENGNDPTHILIHRKNFYVVMSGTKLPLGFVPASAEAGQFLEMPEGQKGVWGVNRKVYKPVMHNPYLGLSVPTPVEGPKIDDYRISSWLPSDLLVEGFPAPGWVTIEWYVPIDDVRHEFWQIALKLCSDENERKAAAEFYETVAVPIGFTEFSQIDVIARERLQEHYRDPQRFGQENFFAGDLAIVSWRKLAARFNRGIQEPPNP
ncbi:MAG TPA: Rieske 2Fe-2S domain-containing protein [Candidatus Binataceae bacterium]|nr:Rieske 2Fe-2S domain-containing protein [Candidatus Binataceae bacterium]